MGAPVRHWHYKYGITAIMNRHMALNMSWAQKGADNDTRGAKHLLLVDRAVTRDCKTRRTNPSTTGVTTRKPITQCQTCGTGMLGAENINRTFKSFHWQLGGSVIDNSISQFKDNYTKKPTSHLLYIDNIKLHAKRAQYINSWILITAIHKDDKCCWTISKRRKWSPLKG